MNNSLIKSTATHVYSCGLPPRMGWLRYRLLKLIFGRIKSDDKQYKVIRALPPEAVIIYVNKTKSKFECLLNYIQCSCNGLLPPRIAFDYRFYVWQPLGRLIQMVRKRIKAMRSLALSMRKKINSIVLKPFQKSTSIKRMPFFHNWGFIKKRSPKNLKNGLTLSELT